jgi:hypothetical protein
MSIESFQLHLSSSLADVYNSGLTSDCEFYLPVIEIPSNFHIHVSIQNFVCPYTFYNINSSNNTLIYLENSIANTITITNGNYNTNTLITELTSKMTRFTITYNSTTNKLTFVNSLYDFTFSTLSTCLSLLGFSTGLSSSSKSLTSDKCVNLCPYRCICISTNFKTFSVNKKYSNNTTLLASIPINTAPNSIIVYENKNNFKSNTFTNNINNIRIKLTDHNFNLLDLNGQHWTKTL